MILPMVKVRLFGRLDQLEEAVEVLQDLGTLQVVASAAASDLVGRPQPTRAQETEARLARRALADIEAVAHHLPTSTPGGEPAAAGRSEIARWARAARRLRLEVKELEGRVQNLEDEQALLEKYRDLLAAFRTLFDRADVPVDAATFCLTLPKEGAEALRDLRREVEGMTDQQIDIRVRDLPTGEVAMLLVVPNDVRDHIERLMSEARIEEVPVPDSYRGEPVARALPEMQARLEAIPGEIAGLRSELATLIGAGGDELLGARSALHDRLLTSEAARLVLVTAHAFIVEGWIPETERVRLERHVSTHLGEGSVVEYLEREEWEDTSAPVVLSNPRLFRPFETIVRFLPLPRYGSIDPTPFVAFFFPVFFGLILGDAGYGLVLILLATLVRGRTRADTTLRSVTHIALACGVFAIVFGAVFGEVFGDLGTRLLSLEPIWFRREEALLPFLGLAVAIGLVHVVLGLVLGAISAFRHRPRQALGRGLQALVVVLIFVSILAAAEILPSGFFTPAAVAILVAFPLLVFAEGIIAPIEILAALSNIFSYARVMALGTASVMMAIVANRMAGAMGSAIVGVLFALLFHLVNFVLGVFSPTIHSLRLHYVEFFGKFYSPGGNRYNPLRHWQPDAGGGSAS